MKRAAVVSSSSSCSIVSWAKHMRTRTQQKGDARTLVQIEDIRADKLDDAVRL
jgi:hypothetical protein